MNYVRRLRLEIPARKLIMYGLADRADEAFSCYPGIPLLAAECEVLPRQVNKHLAWLRHNGYISDRERFRSNGSQTTNRYYLHGPWDDYGGTGSPLPEIAFPERTDLDEKPFRSDTRAGGGVSYRTAPGVSSRTSPPCPPRQGRGVSEDTGGMSSGPPLGVSSETALGVSSRPPLESSVEPSVGTLTRTQGSSSVGTVTVPAARGGDWEEDKDALTGVLTPAVREALDLLHRVPAPAGRRGMTYTEMLELVPLVVRCLGEPWPWSKIELLHELSRDLGDVRNVQRLALDRLKKLNPLRLPEDGGLWPHERPAPPVRQVLVPCVECARPMKGEAPADGLCQDCRTEMARAVDAAVSGGAGVGQVDLVDVDGHDQVPGQLGVPLADDLAAGTAEDRAG
jgi:hypothetical protein